MQPNISDPFVANADLLKFEPETKGTDLYLSRLEHALAQLGKRGDRAVWAREKLHAERGRVQSALAAIPREGLEAAREAFRACLAEHEQKCAAIESASTAQALVLAKADVELHLRVVRVQREAFIAACRAASRPPRGLELQQGLSMYDRDSESAHLARLSPGLDGYPGHGYACPAYERACRGGKMTEPAAMVWEIAAETDFIASPLAEKMFALRWEYFARAHGLAFDPVVLAPHDETLAQAQRRKTIARWDAERAELARQQAARRATP